MSAKAAYEVFKKEVGGHAGSLLGLKRPRLPNWEDLPPSQKRAFELALEAGKPKPAAKKKTTKKKTTKKK